MASNLTPAVTESSFDQDVLNSSTPVVVDFWASWCAPCRAIAPMLESAASDYQGQLKIAKVDVTPNPSLASKYNVRSIPCLIIFNNGQEVDRYVGALNRGSFDNFVGKSIGLGKNE